MRVVGYTKPRQCFGNFDGFIIHCNTNCSDMGPTVDIKVRRFTNQSLYPLCTYTSLGINKYNVHVGGGGITTYRIPVKK